MKKILSVICCIGIVGCTTTPLPTSPIITRDTSIHIDPRLLEDCPNLEHLQLSKYSQGESLEAVKVWANEYSECKTRHHVLSLLVKQAFNLTDTNQ